MHFAARRRRKKPQKMKTKITVTLLLIGLTVIMSGCGGCSWREPQEGTVEVKTVYGNITRIIRPSDGGVWENWGATITIRSGCKTKRPSKSPSRRRARTMPA